jgi:hypothetical protein
MFQRSLPDGDPRPCLERGANRLTETLAVATGNSGTGIMGIRPVKSRSRETSAGLRTGPRLLRRLMARTVLPTNDRAQNRDKAISTLRSVLK